MRLGIHKSRDQGPAGTIAKRYDRGMKSLGKRAAGARLERMKASPRWEGDRFRNLYAIPPGLRDPNASMPSLSDFLCGGERRVPSGPLPSVNPLESLEEDADQRPARDVARSFDVLIEIDGVRVLTDPVWGPRASPSTARGSEAISTGPLSRLESMPPVDVVIVSHDHYDHLDYPTIRELAQAQRAVRDLARRRRPSRGLGRQPCADHRTRLVGVALPARGGVTVTAAPSQHFSGRGLKDRNATLWSSMVLRSANHSVLLQRRYGTHGTSIELIRERLGPFDLVMLEIGAYHPGLGRHPSRAAKRSQGADAARRRSISAGALGHVQSGDARLGSACRGITALERKVRPTAGNAQAGRSDRTRSRTARRTVVAQSRYAEHIATQSRCAGDPAAGHVLAHRLASSGVILAFAFD